jgi:pimeloyl-ACP methyl ester carboxylesterase
MQRAEVDGLTIAFERAGQGPPLVLLHGGVSDHREWRRQLDDLSDAFTIVAWDAPGCGGSSDPPETFRLPEYAACLAGFIDALGLERPHVLGLSWGSTLALELYRRGPDIPRSLILASAYAGWAGSLAPDIVADRLRTNLRGLEKPAEEFVRPWIPTLLTERAPADMVEELATIMREFHPAGARTMLRSMAEADLRDVLPTIAVPTLLLYGAEDRRSPLDVAEAMHAQIPGSTLVILPGAGHMTNIEAAGPFDSAVRDFVGSL